MQASHSRAGRWPLALILAAATVLGACADEPVGPRAPITSARLASTLPLSGEPVIVTTTSGGTEVGSLRWAAGQVQEGAGWIEFDPSLAGDTITLEAGLDVPKWLYILGPAEKGITISGGDQTFIISAGLHVTLVNVTLTKGYGQYASAIWSGTHVSLYNSTVQGNRGAGATIHADGLTIVNSTISGNEAGLGAVEYSYGATVTIDNSTIAANHPGPGLREDDNAHPHPSSVTLRNSIVSGNGVPLRNCATAVNFHYEGMNLSNDYSCGNTTGIVVLDAMLLPLAANGGPTMTHALHHRSPAINAGVSCLQETDQRHVARDVYCDIGAFEFTDFTVVTITIDPSARVTATGQALMTGTVRCSRDEDELVLRVGLEQRQKVGKTTTIVRGETGVGTTCATSAQPWSAALAPSSGAFTTGTAVATAATNDTPTWMTPASVSPSVKMVRAKP